MQSYILNALLSSIFYAFSVAAKGLTALPVLTTVEIQVVTFECEGTNEGEGRSGNLWVRLGLFIWENSGPTFSIWINTPTIQVHI